MPFRSCRRSHTGVQNKYKSTRRILHPLHASFWPETKDSDEQKTMKWKGQIEGFFVYLFIDFYTLPGTGEWKTSCKWKCIFDKPLEVDFPPPKVPLPRTSIPFPIFRLIVRVCVWRWVAFCSRFREAVVFGAPTAVPLISSWFSRCLFQINFPTKRAFIVILIFVFCGCRCALCSLFMAIFMF